MNNSRQNNTVLIAGASGFIGSAISSSLNAEYKILIANRNEFDLEQYDEAYSMIQTYNPRILINATGRVAGIQGNLDNPTEASGVVLIDELDIHLHPSWQREIAGWLQEVFPKLQFFVATHSPLIAAGAGPNSLTLRIDLVAGELEIVEIPYLELAANVDRTLTSAAFGLKSTYPTETENKIKRYHQLNRKNKNLAAEEKEEYEQLSLFVGEVKPFGEISQPNSLESRIDALLEERLS